jgi:5-methylcytosine-specific restriction endonuclease McrA
MTTTSIIENLDADADSLQSQERGPNVNKPSWCTTPDWVQFLKKYQGQDGLLRCEITKQQWLREGRAFDDAAVPLAECIDHIIPRNAGGSSKWDNLQPATEYQNLVKSAKLDPNWSHPTFFDQPLDRSALRQSQLIAGYDTGIEMSELWTENWSALSALPVIGLLAWVVRSGKLFGAVVLAVAINHAKLKAHGRACPRIRRILIIAHDKANRDQYAAELGGDSSNGKPGKWEKLGVTERPPTVLVVEDGATMQNKNKVSSADIILCCNALLWTEKGQPFAGDKFPQILSQFDLIVVDEPHIATGQVRFLAQQANCPVIGTTGTPHDKDHYFDPTCYALISIWTKQQADQHDGSLKHLPDDIDPASGELTAMSAKHPWFKVLDPKAAQSFRHENIDLTRSEVEGHDKQFISRMQVAHEVVLKCRELDDVRSLELAPHRENGDWTPSLTYSAHGLVTVDGIETAEAVATQLNDYFKQNRSRFPLDKGWTAAAAHGGRVDQSKTRAIPAKPLGEGHPWLHSDRKLNATGIDKNCARILIVDQMGREGTSNPCCAVVGFACEVNSKIESSQRGSRGLGANIDFKNKLCPTVDLDQPYIITHSCFGGNVQAIRDALAYIIDMESHLKALMPLESFVNTGGQQEDDSERNRRRAPMAMSERVEVVARIAELVGGDRQLLDESSEAQEKVRATMQEWIEQEYSGSDRKKAYAEELVEAIVESPRAAAAILQANACAQVYRDVLLQESRHHQLTEDDLVRYTNLRNGCDYPRENILLLKDLFLKQFEEDHQVEVTPQRSGASVNDLCRTIASLAFTSIRDANGKLPNKNEKVTGSSKPGRSEMGAFSFANAAAVGVVKRMLHCDESLKDGGRYDIPQCHHLIHTHWNELIASVRAQLIKRVPSLKTMAALVWVEDQDQAIESEVA